MLLLLLLWVGPAAAGPKIVVLGDSLSAAFGIPVASGWVALLQERLKREGYPHEVVNASISGETTSGGLARLHLLLAKHDPQLVLIELGGNDGLRGLPVKTMEQNLTRIAEFSRKAGAVPVLFEMTLPSNYGQAYVRGFTQAFGRVAQAQKAPLVPFFLASIATDAGAFLDDGIHPAASAQPRMLEAVWPILEPLLKK